MDESRKQRGDDAYRRKADADQVHNDRPVEILHDDAAGPPRCLERRH